MAGWVGGWSVPPHWIDHREQAFAGHEAAVDEIIAANPAQVAKAKENPKLAGWFVGQVMKATGGKANPGQVNEILRTKLGKS